MSEEALEARRKKIISLKRLAGGDFYREVGELADMIDELTHGDKEVLDSFIEIASQKHFLLSDERSKSLKEIYELIT